MTRHLLAPLLAAGALCALTACQPYATTYLRTNAPPRPLQARTPDSVQIFTAAGRPQRAFVEVGILETREDMLTGKDMVDILQEMRRVAAGIGCDAVIVNGASPHESGEVQHEGYWGSCVVYVEPTAAAVSSPPPAR